MANNTAAAMKPQSINFGLAKGEFGYSPRQGLALFTINPEASADLVQSHASCLARGLRDRFLKADKGVTGDEVWGVWVALDQLVGLIDALEFICREAA
jgi:hypothetical protein